MLKKFLAISAFIFFLMPSISFAQSSWSVLPYTEKNASQCGDLVKTSYEKQGTANVTSEILACAIKSGRFHLAMLPYYVSYLIKIVLSLAGLISVLFIILGGYQYVVAGISEKQDAAKKSIKNAIFGFALSMLAYVIVSVIQAVVTS